MHLFAKHLPSFSITKLQKKKVNILAPEYDHILQAKQPRYFVLSTVTEQGNFHRLSQNKDYHVFIICISVRIECVITPVLCRGVACIELIAVLHFFSCWTCFSYLTILGNLSE